MGDDFDPYVSSDGYHVLKTWPEPFEAVRAESKTFEFRKADRNFEEGDLVLLREWDSFAQRYTGRSVTAEIGYVLRAGAFGVPQGYCAFSLLYIEEQPRDRTDSAKEKS